MKKLDDEQLSKFLEIDNKIEKKSQEIIERQKSNVEIYKDKETRNNDIEEDYQYHRELLKDLVSMGQESLQNLMMIAKESEHPRAYEVTAGLLKTTGDLAKDLIELQLTMNKIENTKDGGVPQKVVNNAILVGSTNELLERLRGKNREEDIDE
jgi:hypothetical protein